jgi:tellurite resistance protein
MMTGFFQQARKALAAELEKFRNRHFLEATMAASALVALADGDVNLTELNMIDQALETIHELKIYDPHDAVDIYRDYMDDLRTDPARARIRILEEVGRIAEDAHAARLLMRVCVAIGKSDDDFSNGEKAVIADLCDALGLDAAEIGL